jgi:sigma-E factor negative regulatory protein RseA
MNSKISALMDGELFEDEADILFDELKHDESIQRDWVMYHLIGDVLRQPEYIRRDMSSMVAEQMVHEPTVFAPRTHALKQKARVFALSAAASVLAVGVVVWMSVQIDAEPAQLARQGNAVRAVNWQVPQKSNDYLAAHQEHSPSADFNGAAAPLHGTEETQTGTCP